MNPEKMSKWTMIALAAGLIFVVGIFIGSAGSDQPSTPIAEMTVEHLFVLVIVAALLIGR